MLEPTQLIVGPAGSGKTQAAAERALGLARRGERVIVLTLPNQRPHFLERLAGIGPSLGVEVTNLQNLCYRLLDRLGENRPVVLNPGRVTVTARALERALGRPVGPGEARLYARAIAECKRHHLRPQETGDPYQDALALAFVGYEQALETADLQDLDDVRLRLTRFMQSRVLELNAHLVVDGYRSLNPSELEAIRALTGSARSSLVTLPGGAPDTGMEAWAHPLRQNETGAIATRLEAKLGRLEGHGKPWAGLPETVNLTVHANPVEEARAVLRGVKGLMRDGAKAQDIAIIIPNPALQRVLEALGREYGVPIAPESLGGALETPEGRRLEALLAAPARDYPARDLRALSVLEPALARLADTLEGVGVVAGSSAYPLVSRDLEALDALDRVRHAAEPPIEGTADELVGWFEGLLERFLRDAPFIESARVVAREAARLLEPVSASGTLEPVSASGSLEGAHRLSGATFADWVRSLLSSVQVPHPDAGRGVAVLGAEESSGRRYAHTFVMGLTDGAYRSGDGEDFFVPEEERRALEHLLAGVPGLPWRLAGLEDTVFYDILTRADQSLTITYPKAERGASLRPHPRLAQLGLEPREARAQPVTASALELAAATQGSSSASQTVWQVRGRKIARAVDLERATQCHLRAWAEGIVPTQARGSGLVSDDLLRAWGSRLRQKRWKGEDTPALEVAPEEHRERLESLAPHFRERLEQALEARVPGQPDVDVQLGYRSNLDGLEFTLDGVRFKRDPNSQVRVVEVFRVLENVEDGYQEFMNANRHREWWFAHAWMERGAIVTLWAWDLTHEPRRIMPMDKPYAQRRLAEAIAALERTRQALESGQITATPGFHCQGCAHRDVCRVAA